MAKRKSSSQRSASRRRIAPRRARRPRATPRRPSAPRVARVERAARGRDAETVEVVFQLRDVRGNLIDDPDARFTFRQLADNRQIGSQIRRPLSGGTARFALPVLAGDVCVCELDLQRYRFARSPVFFRSPGDAVVRSSVLFREPLEWAPSFTAWDALPAAFADLKAALENAPDVMLHRTRQSLGKLTGTSYDGMSGADVLLAKTGLLNTTYRLRATMEPVSDARSWLSFVQRIIAIDRERFLAMVHPDMAKIVRQISEHIDDFRGEYERTPAENHRPNVPAAMQARIVKMISIKSSHSRGNFQLTITELAAPDEVLLDADIDENGELLAHLFDLVKHKFTGGTHPHDIYEILSMQDGQLAGFDVGYQLV